MEFINKYIFGAGVPIFLFSVAIMLIITLSGKPFVHPIRTVRGMFSKKRSGGVSPIKAVLLALAGTLGVGNIVGVASAIALGGAGAVFWMWISAIFAMILKYAEAALAVSHRRYRNGESYGGAMYYMKDAFDRQEKPMRALIFPSVFALLCIVNAFSVGCVIQSNAVSESFHGIMGVPRWLVGVLIAIFAGIVFFGRGKRIFSAAASLVPAVSVIYIVMSVIVIVNGADRIPQILSDIFGEAFSLSSAAGGAAGFLLSRGLRYGTIRGLLSNEAGCGTAPIAHAASNTDSPAEQGFLGMLEVFVDTIVLCTMTAFVILLNMDASMAFADDPIMMAFAAFSQTLGGTSEVLLCISVLLFAFATIICWGYYGKECVYFFTKSKKHQTLYFAAYTAFAFLGSITSMGGVWQIADLSIGGMTLMNLFVLCKMRGEIKDITLSYFKKRTRN